MTKPDLSHQIFALTSANNEKEKAAVKALLIATRVPGSNIPQILLMICNVIPYWHCESHPTTIHCWQQMKVFPPGLDNKATLQHFLMI